jgi:hypothetical protein
MDNQLFESFKALVDQFKERGILWMTGLSQIQARVHDSVRSTVLPGLCDQKYSWNSLLVKLTASVDSIIIDVFEKFKMRQENHILKPEFE